MSHLNPSKFGTVSKPAPSQNNSFERAVMSNMKESIEKHLSHVKIDQNTLNHALMLSIDNFRLEEHADECLLILLRHKANPNCQVDLQTPLTAACKKGQQLIVKTLLDYGAKPQLCNKKGEHPLEIILFDKRQNYDVAQTLISYLPSVNIEIKGQAPLVVSVEREFLKIFQMLIEKGASLVYENENILHIIMKKKFRKLGKKKKFMKELAGRFFLLQPDSKGLLPLQYEQNQQIQAYWLEIFKPKVVPKEKQISNSKSKVKELKELIHKQSDSSLKEGKRKNKDLDVSFSEVDDDDYQEEKADGGESEKKLSQVIEIPEEEIVEPEKKETKMEEPDEKNNKQNKSSEEIKVKELQKSPATLDVCLEQIQANDKAPKKQLNQSTKLTQNSSFNQGKKKNKGYCRKNTQEDFISKNLNKMKNSSSFEEELNSSIKIEKNKGQKKGRTKKELEQEVKKQKILEAQMKELAEEQQRIVQGYENIEKLQKESETDSQESYQGDLASLNEEIFSLVNKITNASKRKEKVVESLIGYIDTAIRHELEQDRKNVRLQIFVYGSQSTGLAVEHSDVDLLVVSDFDCFYLMRLLEERNVLELADVSDAKFISSASMPVIKMRMSAKYDKMNVDLTFQTRNHMGLKCSETIQAFMQAQPLLRPLVLVIKTLVHRYGLSDPYKGGIGSYGVTLMVIALLQFTEKQKKTEQNIGQLLINFFYFYGIELDYICQAIIVHELGYADQPLYSIYRLPYLTDLNPKLVIYDPLNPVNNVGRTTYRISTLKKLFSISYFRLKNNPPSPLAALLDGSFMELLDDY